MKTVIYHSADYDGIFCREIARHFLGDKDVNYIGWNFGDKPIEIPSTAIYVMDLPLDRVFGFEYKAGDKNPPQHPTGLVWIDHHKSSIETHPTAIPGYRIDGVAACRLAWQWFYRESIEGQWELPPKEAYTERKVSEPLAVRLAGEYDIWDKRDLNAYTFQYGIQVRGETLNYELMFNADTGTEYAMNVVRDGLIAQSYAQKIDADLVTHRSYRMDWEGLSFIVLNTGRFNSLTFAALDKPETGHDALLGYMFNGKCWTVSLYHAKHRTDLDLSPIAVKHGGGGHRGACGFTCSKLPFST
jgi:oligoribonuclease NrnB/cAMP/cGMP phosphodiesterase (DHH superfamily)